MAETSPISAPPTKLPAPLSKAEKRWTIALLAIGAVILGVAIAWFATSTGGELLSKETTTTGTGAGQKIEAKEYSDSVLLAALGIGGAFVLAGAFYGRIREIKLPGGVALVVGDIPEPQKAVVDKKIDEAAQASTNDTQQQQVIRDVAATLAQAQYIRDTSARPTLSTPTGYLEQLGERSVGQAKDILRLR